MSRNFTEMTSRSLSLTLVLLLAACGGGGSGGDNAAHWDAPAPSATPTGERLGWEFATSNTTTQKLAFTMPDGLAIKQDGSNGVVTMEGNNGKPTTDLYYGECRIALVNVTNDKGLTLDNLALETLNKEFLSEHFKDSNQNIFGDNPANWSEIVSSWGANSILEDSYHLQGLSGEGWPYVELQGRLQRAGGAALYENVRILLAQLNNNQYAAMIGYDYRYNLCLDFGANDAGKWLKLVYSLSFPEYQAADPDALRKKLFGGWYGTYTAPTYTTHWSHVFSANGNDLSEESISVYTPISNTSLVYETSSTWTGNGKWQLNNGKLSIWTNLQQPVTNYIRYFQSWNQSAWDINLRTLGPCTDTNDNVTTATICERHMIKRQ